MKNKSKKFRIVYCGCQDCAGRGIVARGHFTRKRGSKPCPGCDGKGEVEKRVPLDN